MNIKADWFFIVNPKSGMRPDTQILIRYARDLFKKHGAGKTSFAFTRYKGHGFELASKAVAEGARNIVAVGGDGTINELLPLAANNPKLTLATLPKGSGNGFARHIGLSMLFRRACTQILNGKTISCDCGIANGRHFINVAGAGLDAAIGHAYEEFGKNGLRGRLPYLHIIMSEFLKYKPQKFYISSNGKTFHTKPVFLTAANTCQYGGGLRIAPKATITDGLLDLVIVEDFTVLEVLPLIPALYAGTLAAPFIKNIKTEAVSLSSPQEFMFHLDGEPIEKVKKLEIKILKKAVNIIVPKEFDG